MLPYQSYCEPVPKLKPRLMEDGDSRTKVERKSTAACNSHSEAERRRRQRINAHLSTLRSLLPSTTKTDKASLLAEVVRHVTELRKRAAEVAAQNGSGFCSGGGGSEAWAIPEETDEVSLGYYEGDERLIKATLCCEDRPSLNRDLTEAIGSVKARVVRAEMATVGGRTKNVVVMQCGGGEAELGNLRRALKSVVENRAPGFGSTQALEFVGLDQQWQLFDLLLYQHPILLLRDPLILSWVFSTNRLGNW